MANPSKVNSNTGLAFILGAISIVIAGVGYAVFATDNAGYANFGAAGNPPSGYKVIFVPFVGGRPSGKPEDILTGFLSEDGDAYGRPVGVAVEKSGALLVADDVGNTVWRVSPAGSADAAAY